MRTMGTIESFVFPLKIHATYRALRTTHIFGIPGNLEMPHGSSFNPVIQVDVRGGANGLIHDVAVGGEPEEIHMTLYLMPGEDG